MAFTVIPNLDNYLAEPPSRLKWVGGRLGWVGKRPEGAGPMSVLVRRASSAEAYRRLFVGS